MVKRSNMVIPSGVDCPRSVSMQPTQRKCKPPRWLPLPPQFCCKHKDETLTALICGPLESVLLWCPHSFTSRIGYESTQCRLQHKGQILSYPLLSWILDITKVIHSVTEQLLLCRDCATVRCFIRWLCQQSDSYCAPLSLSCHCRLFSLRKKIGGYLS
jgi:hypothetical protein